MNGAASRRRDSERLPRPGSRISVRLSHCSTQVCAENSSTTPSPPRIKKGTDLELGRAGHLLCTHSGLATMAAVRPCVRNCPGPRCIEPKACSVYLPTTLGWTGLRVRCQLPRVSHTTERSSWPAKRQVRCVSWRHRFSRPRLAPALASKDVQIERGPRRCRKPTLSCRHLELDHRGSHRRGRGSRANHWSSLRLRCWRSTCRCPPSNMEGGAA